MSRCYICPRKCGADRENGTGFCGGGRDFKVSKIMIHRGEEPVISGTNGSGAIFFGGCNLRCVYCQNAPISIGNAGKIFSFAELESAVFSLAEKGAENIDFITAAHYADLLAPFLEKIKPRLSIPIVYNSGGYESAETLKQLDGLVDVYLPDFKYADDSLAEKYSSAPDYRETAEAAIGEMIRQQSECVIEDGIIKRGVIIRHLVLPAARNNGIAVMRIIAEKFPSALVSVMRQYTPTFNRSRFKELDRKVTSFEYDSVAEEAEKLGLKGFVQQKGCETNELTPNFDTVFG